MSVLAMGVSASRGSVATRPVDSGTGLGTSSPMSHSTSCRDGRPTISGGVRGPWRPTRPTSRGASRLATGRTRSCQGKEKASRLRASLTCRSVCLSASPVLSPRRPRSGVGLSKGAFISPAGGPTPVCQGGVGLGGGATRATSITTCRTTSNGTGGAGVLPCRRPICGGRGGFRPRNVTVSRMGGGSFTGVTLDKGLTGLSTIGLTVFPSNGRTYVSTTPTRTPRKRSARKNSRSTTSWRPGPFSTRVTVDGGVCGTTGVSTSSVGPRTASVCRTFTCRGLCRPEPTTISI